mmetsp:Transcript_22705/g.44555  ORF Transcript_22705/g.44555 Transcript_22705/m.44555 type:complete len:220 (-) Transcript_22705:345-1004(-)|eukprot:CAMPEP_0171530460 /NCGR_PEP_ID=MMETSP0959-20130129/13097_1 /TAXON_ID=87120 /ORGANISM="Aurantiochytrium limacinum, Strain ATCCMYA-1381" /LENGTH=219 /DNA_ID=CAMNT_0012073269 /DNA_START=33 /DNA_END=692 /DNA_ORIENTATION=+
MKYQQQARGRKTVFSAALSVLLLILASFLVHGVSADVAVEAVFDVRGVVATQDTLSGSSVSLLLDGKPAGLVRRDGTFVLRDVAPGTYSLEVSTTTYGYPLYIVEVAKTGKISATYWFGKRRRELQHPLTLEPYGVQSYFEPRKTLSIMSLFMNPMVLMMAVMMGLMFVLPKLQEGMDPEELKKLQEDMKKSQADQPDPQKLLGSMFGGGNTDEDSDSD